MSLTKKLLLSLLLLSIHATAMAAFFCNPFEPDTLEGIEASLSERYTSFPHLTPKAVQEMMNKLEPLILLDVRPPDEFNVSHLPGAIQIDPDADVIDVRRKLGQIPPKARVVFYCSVGSRSSKLAARVGKDLIAEGVSSIANLRGGIFAWHNDGKMAVNAQGPTWNVHPYDSCRAPLLKPLASIAAH